MVVKMKLSLKELKIGESIVVKPDEKDSLISLIESNVEMAAFIKSARKKKKKTQDEIATFANISRLALNEFENDKSDIRLSTLLKILQACDLELVVREK